MTTPVTTIPVLTHPSFQSDAIQYGYFTRKGGVSHNAFDSLNCGVGSGDLLDHVYENHRRIAAVFNTDAANLLFCKQIHSDKVVTVTAPWERHVRPEADAMVTKEKGIALAVMSADCAPVLFYDTKHHIIGAVHSGWKGAVKGVLEETIAAIEQLGGSAKSIQACIGPCIQQSSYTVRDDLYHKFIKRDPNNSKFFVANAEVNSFQFDMSGYIEQRLLQSGIQHVYKMEQDTKSDEEQFFSFRRKTLQNELSNGVQMSVITLR